jgi:hypothetical protein
MRGIEIDLSGVMALGLIHQILLALTHPFLQRQKTGRTFAPHLLFPTL